jgi:23S rRNA-/tRNA-specific pseudouridylate synthase
VAPRQGSRRERLRRASTRCRDTLSCAFDVIPTQSRTMRDPIIEAPAPGRLCVPHQAVHVTLAVLPDRCGSGATLVRLSPRTGRTHQLRVHCASGLGASIIGDVKYGFGQGNSAATADFVRSKLGSNHVQLCLHATHIGVSASRTLLCTFAIPATRAPIVVPANYHSTAQHSTAQHSTAQHSTAQHSLGPAR